jgi:cystine transport system permease protein
VNLIDLDLMVKSVPFLLKGAGYTVELSLGGMVFGLGLGFVIALMRLSTRAWLRGTARVYVSFIRGTPLLVQLFVIYYGLAQFGIRLDPIPSALIGLSLNVAGYTGEILRAAIASIDRGQWEASKALGLSWPQTMRLVIIPQAARVALPPLGNSFISLVKDTSLAATIQVPELFRQAQLITARTFQIFTMYFTAALLYWIISTALAALQERLERRASAHVRAS